MSKFFYTAKSLSGEEKNETAEARDIHQLARNLREQGLILIKAEPAEKVEKKGFEFSLPFFGVPLTQKMFFARNLQVMISAGLPLPRAILILASQTKSKKFKDALMEIREEVTRGKSFSESLAKYPNIFSEFFQSMIKVGEESGTLEEVLKNLALQMERENDLKSKLKGAMIYPSVVISAMVGVGILMLVMVVPQLADTFKELDVELPLTTKMVIGLADFLTKRWYLAIILLLTLPFFLWQALKIKTGKRIIDSIMLKTPVISSIVKNTNSAFLVRTLSSLISSGVSLPRALEITSGTLGNIFYKEALIEATEKVRKGEKLSEALKPYEKTFSSTVIQMIAVGEETGATSSILTKLADFFEDEVGNSTKNLVSAIEPILMIIIGAVVGFFAISMIQPMYSMLGAIQ